MSFNLQEPAPAAASGAAPITDASPADLEALAARLKQKGAQVKSEISLPFSHMSSLSFLLTSN